MLRDVQAGRRDLERAAEALATRLPEPLGVFARLAYNYRWAWDPDGPDVFRDDRPRPLGAGRREPGEAAAGGRDRPAGRPPQNDGAARPRRGARGARRAPTSRARAATTVTHARAPDRVLLRRVRLPRLVPDLLGRPRRARRRHPQGGLRPRVAAGRGRPAVPQRLLPPAHRRRRLAARVLGRHRPGPPARRARHRRRRRADHDHASRSATIEVIGADLARRHRPRPALPARRRAPGELPDRALDHVAACTSATRTRAWRSTCCSASAASARSRRWGSSPSIVHLNEGHAAFVSLELARREYSGNGSLSAALEIAPQAARSSPPTRRSRRATTPTPRSRSRTRSRTSPGRSASTPTEIIRLGRTNPEEEAEPFGVTQFALRTSRAANGVSPPPRRGRARDVAGDVARARPSTTSRSPTSPTACTSRPGSASRCGSCSTATSARTGWTARPTPRPGRRSTTSRPRSCGTSARAQRGAADRVRAPPRRRRPARARRAARRTPRPPRPSTPTC